MEVRCAFAGRRRHSASLPCVARLLPIAQSSGRDTEVPPTSLVFRVQLRGSLVVSARKLPLSTVLVEKAKVVNRRGPRWRALDRGQIGRCGAGGITRVRQAQPLLVECFGRSRVGHSCLAMPNDLTSGKASQSFIARGAHAIRKSLGDPRSLDRHSTLQ